VTDMRTTHHTIEYSGSPPPHAASYLADAFDGYPLVDWLLQEDATDPLARQRLLQVLVEAYRLVGARFSWIAPEGPVAVWTVETPHRPMRTDPRLAILFLRSLRKVVLRRLVQVEVASEKWNAFPSSLNLLNLIGTKYDCRRSGLARALISDFSSRSSGAIFAETSLAKNLTFYQDMGFTCIGRYRINVTGPPVWTLRMN
jgi:hypothetical protein